MPDSEQAPIHHVSMKTPAFMESAAAGWFSIMEAQFHLKGITVSETKYFHVIAALPAEIVAKLSATVLENRDYDALKTAVIDSYESTKPELFEKLISKTTMSGRPSVYLQELNATATKIGVGEDLIRHKFIQACPPAISPVLAAQRSLNLQQLGSLADELLPYFGEKVLHVQQTASQKSTYYEKNRNSSQIPTGLRPFSTDQRPKVCRAHLYFADKARTCKPWCKWPNKRNCNMQPSSRSSSPIPPQHSEN